MDWYIKVLQNYAVFQGRAQRMEFWMFVLFNFIITIGISMVEATLGFGGQLGILYGLAIFIPGIAVSVRRLHDTGRTGWWLLLGLVPLIGPLVLLIFYCINGDAGDNEYGADPQRY